MITKIIYNNPQKIPGLSMDFQTSFGSEDSVESIFKSYKEIFKNYDIYEFGTYLGQSLCGILTYMDENKIEFNNFLGFDSFKGLPNEVLDKNNNPYWNEGRYSINKYVSKEYSVEDYKHFLNDTKRLPKKYFDKFKVVKGFYDETLKDSLIQEENLKLPLFINIDCDLYTSTNQVLDFIFRNNLFIPNKTIIRYDDWANDKNEYSTGQSKSHIEMTKKYNINTELLLKHSYYGDPECTWWIIK
jgi:hypothetical protein